MQEEHIMVGIKEGIPDLVLTEVHNPKDKSSVIMINETIPT